jgi:hypothetical protein
MVSLMRRVKKEKVDLAAERERLHSDIIKAMTELTSHISYVQGKLNEGVQVLTEKKRAAVEMTSA